MKLKKYAIKQVFPNGSVIESDYMSYKQAQKLFNSLVERYAETRAILLIRRV